MPRRSRSKADESLVNILLDKPWQVSVILAGVVFVFMRWVIPSQFNSKILLPLGNISSGFAPITAIFFLFIGVVSYFRHRGNVTSKPSNRRFTPTTTAPYKNRFPDTDTEINHTYYIPEAETEPNIKDWSLELLQSLEWKRFEMLCAEYFRVLGKHVETTEKGADGGIDVRVYNKNNDAIEYAIQCKSWNSMVGVKHIRELFGVMAHESAGKGIFMTTSGFSDDAKKFAAEHKEKLFLVDGKLFLSMLSKLPEEKRRLLLEFATEGDYTTPTCASCGIKMVRRQGRSGEFWGCMNYPRCHSRINIAT